ncbi:MAG: hypothetical protein U9N02_06025, partial [Campylobacterota bacterium]|nr:hypothetical protein [Campylobacterota bacterium]
MDETTTNNQIGVVQNLDGTFYVKDADGNVVELQNGDVIEEGMVIVGDDGNPSSATVEIVNSSNESLVLSGTGEQTLDASFLENFSSESSDVSASNEERLDEITEGSDSEVVDGEPTIAVDDSYEATEDGQEQGVDDGQSVSDNLLANDIVEDSSAQEDLSQDTPLSESNLYEVDNDLENDLTTTNQDDTVTVEDDVEEDLTINTRNGDDTVTV